MIQAALHLMASALVAYSLLSLIEYLIHRHIMHRPGLAKILDNEMLRAAFVNHALMDHKRCYAVFDREIATLGLSVPDALLALAGEVIE